MSWFCDKLAKSRSKANTAQTQQPVETYPGPEHFEHLPKHRVIQNGDPIDNKDVPTARGVGHLHTLQGCILPYTNSQSVQESRFDLREGKVRPTPERWQTFLTGKILSILSGPVWPVRQFMSLIGLLTATEKQVHLGHWRVPESLEKVIPIPGSLHPHLRWWLEESNVLLGQPLHPLKHALQIFKDASKEGLGAHLNEHTARGTWSLPERKLHINHWELKAVFLALKALQNLCSNNIVLVATDNTTVVAYINKVGGMKMGSLCALLWRILSWCTRKPGTLKAHHIPSRLNVIADKLSRLGQTI